MSRRRTGWPSSTCGGIGTEPDPIAAAAWYILARRAGLVDPEMDDFLDGLTDEQTEAGAGAGQPAALSWPGAGPSSLASPRILWS